MPSGTTGYPDLIENSHVLVIGDVTAKEADLAEVIRSKSAAGRPKDIEVLLTMIRYEWELVEDV